MAYKKSLEIRKNSVKLKKDLFDRKLSFFKVFQNPPDFIENDDKQKIDAKLKMIIEFEKSDFKKIASR